MNTLKVILYFSIFKYPLTKSEILSFSTAKNEAEIEKELLLLMQQNIIFKIDNFYSDSNDITLANRRRVGNKMAEEIMPKALKRAKLIMKFPFVKSVCISGSLSKEFYDDDGDIDFFIITDKNHLWIARSLLVAYKKIILLNSKKYFCVNYFISLNNLKITEKNKFTATELVTLLPIYGGEIFKSFIKENLWYKEIFPNRLINYNYLQRDFKKPFFSKILQLLIRNKIGRSIDVFFKKITLHKWKSKFKHLKKKEFNVAMKSTNDVSKHHPQDFQSKVIIKLNNKYMQNNKTHNLNLALENA